MSKFIKGISALAVILVAAVMLASCEYNFYGDWSKAGAEIEKENIFEVVTVDSAKAMIEEDKTFVLVLGSSNATLAPSTMTTLQDDADYLGFEGKLQFIDCAEFVNKPADRKMLKEAFGVNDPSKISSNLVVLIYDKGNLLLDTTDAATDDKLKHFVDGSSVNYSALATYIYTEFNFE